MSGDRARLAKLLRARHPCITIVATDEVYVLEAVVAAAVELGRAVLTWSSVRGITSGMFNDEVEARAGTQAPLQGIRQLMRESHHSVFITLDLADHLEDAVTARGVRELISHCQRVHGTLIMIDHRERLPDAIMREAVRFDPSLPDDDELAALAKETLHRLKAQDQSIAVRISAVDFQAMVRNLRGLTRSQAEQVVSDAAVDDDCFDSDDVQFVLSRKRQVLKGDGLLEQVEVAITLAEVAGIDELAHWLRLRQAALDGSIPGVEPPRGVILLGVPGSGKSLCAKAIATAWGRPLMRLDAGVLYDKWVGESESRLRQALRQAEAMAPMVLWVDEIEKAFASAASHSTDGGLSQRLFGALLTWMQERRAAVFLVATANDIEALPPELLRKGRFDEIFFLDLPDETTRRDLFRIHLAKRQRDPALFDLVALAAATAQFSGAEIEHAVATSLLEAHGLGRAVDTALVASVIAVTTPLAVTMAEQVARLRAWARLRCRPAGRSVGQSTATSTG